MASAWVKAQDRKRNLAAALSTACIYIIAFLGAWAIGLIAPQSLASMPGTVIVDLGGEGPGGEVPLGLPNAPDRPEGAPPGAAPLPAGGAEAASLPEPAPVDAATKAAAIPEPAKATPPKAAPKAAPKTAPKATAPKAVAKAPAKTIPDQAAKTPEETAAEAAAAEAAATAAAERAAAEDAAVRAAAATAAAAAGPAKTKTFGAKAGSSSGGAPVTGSGTGSGPGVAGGTGSVTFRGSEMGSALTTTFGASSGQVGRNIYVPIYLYMPLPQSVSADVYRNITAKETFRSYYEQSGSDWKLKAQIAVSQRGEVWTMLEAAGFDASTADYKTSRKLSPVVLEFAVGPAAKNRAELVDVRLVTSSGSAEVDEAVLYGFRQASFFNKTGFAIGGKFIYGF